LADANENRDWRIYQDFALNLIQKARKRYAEDSFSLELTHTVCAWRSSRWRDFANTAPAPLRRPATGRIRRRPRRRTALREALESPTSRRRGQGAFAPLCLPPATPASSTGATNMSSWAGQPRVVKLTRFRLTHSRQMFLAAYPRESQEMVFDAYNPRLRLLRQRATRVSVKANS